MSTLIHQPHDKFFKLAMAEKAVAREFFAEHLPKKLLEQIDMSTLELEKNSFIDKAFKASESDVIYSVNFKGRKAYLYLLCENQAEIDFWMALRLLHYLIQLLEAHRKQNSDDVYLPVVYPLVIYSGQKVWDAPRHFFDLFGNEKELMQEILLNPYQLIDVYRIEDEKLREHLLSGLLQFVLKHRQIRDCEQYLQKFLPWVKKVEIEQEMDFARIVLHYAGQNIASKDAELFTKKAQEYLPEPLRGEVMSLEQYFVEKGIKQGMQQGMQQGMKKGEMALLLEQLQYRFHTVPEQYRKRIEEADIETLLKWAKRLLAAQSLEEIFH